MWFVAQCTLKGQSKSLYIACYQTEREAAEMHDKACIYQVLTLSIASCPICVPACDDVRLLSQGKAKYQVAHNSFLLLHRLS